MIDLGLGRATVFIPTLDRARAIGFYAGILGFRMQAEDDHGALFDMGGTDVRLTDIADHAPSPHPILGFAVADIRAVCAQLAGRGVPCLVYPGFGQDEAGIWSAPDGALHLAWVADPDGNVIGLHQRG